MIRFLKEDHRVVVEQFARFGTVGVIGFFFDYAVFHLAYEFLGFGHYGSAFFSYPFTVTLTWMGNRLFTFRGKNQGSPHAQFMRFIMVCAVGLLINRGTFSLMTATIPLVYRNPILGLLGGTGAGMFFNFFFSRRVVFK